MPTPPKKVDLWEKDLILDVFVEHGFPREEADKAIRRESGWNPAALNKASGAAGLIQFMPSTLRGMKYTGRPFHTLSAAEQMPYIHAYLSRVPRWKLPGDTYLALAAPAFIGKPDDTVIYPVGSAAWRMNPSLRSADDGPITAASVRKLVA